MRKNKENDSFTKFIIDTALIFIYLIFLMAVAALIQNPLWIICFIPLYANMSTMIYIIIKDNIIELRNGTKR